MYRQPIPLALADLPVPANDPATLQVLLQPRLSLFWGADTPTRALLACLTVLAVEGHNVQVFDGGNRFDGYFIARLARRLSDEPHAVLERIRLSRAFTCFQLAQLIESAPAIPTKDERGEGVCSALFVLDLLNTFYDESVPLRDVERLLTTTVTHLKRLAAVGPVIVGAREPRVLVKERWTLLDQLQVAADSAWLLRSPDVTSSTTQLNMFS
ncbi:MAG: hypothetical protein PVF18_13115 [Anaerolineales bacterium]|jgi:hypothetical protein